MSTGSAALSKLTLNPPKLLELKMPVPPRAEQERIVDWIEASAGRIDEAKRLRVEADAAAESLIFSACDEELQILDRAWPSSPLGDLVDPFRGISYGIVQTGPVSDGGVPTLRAGDLRWFDVNVTGIKHVAVETSNAYRRTVLRGGEVLLRIRGGVGAVAVCPSSMVGGNVSREIAVVPFLDHVSPEFAMYLLAATSSQKRMAGHVKGTSYVGLNLTDVRTLRIPVPPIAVQNKVTEKLRSIREKASLIRNRHQQIAGLIEAVVPSMLEKAFRGG